MEKERNWNEVKEKIVSMGAAFTEDKVSDQLSAYIRKLGYVTYPILVDLRALETVDAQLGVVVTCVNEETNNGVYVFVVLRNHSYGLVTVIPSTISKAPMVRRVSGDMTTAILGVDHPPLEPFDMMEIAMHTLLNTFLTDIRIAYHIPDEYKDAFLKRYLAVFLRDMAHYYNGTLDKDGKPLVNEEIVNMQPACLRDQLLGLVPDGMIEKEERKGESDEKGASSNAETDTSSV